MSLPSLDPSSSMDLPAQAQTLMTTGSHPMSMDTSPAPANVNTMSNTVTSTVSPLSSSMASVPMTGALSAVGNSIHNATAGSVQNVSSVLQSSMGSSQVSKPSPNLNTVSGGPTASGIGMSSLKNQGSSSASLSGSSNISSDMPAQILSKARLQDLVREIDPSAQLDEEVEEMLMQLADDFVETCVSSACLFAKHRKANTIDVKDVQLHLERNWNMWIPGFGTDELRPYKRASVTEAHKQRLALIRKALKKY